MAFDMQWFTESQMLKKGFLPISLILTNAYVYIHKKHWLLFSISINSIYFAMNHRDCILSAASS